MNTLFTLTPAILICLACVLSLCKGVDLYAAMTAGAAKGLRLMADILPALICLFPAIAFLRASGVPEMLENILSPLFNALGIPPETSLLMLVRPLSGSAAMSAANDIMTLYGADSLIGRTAAVMLGSSETTFYVIAVYFSAANVKESRWAIPAALIADLACFLSSAWICRLLWG
ncbi:MAG: nucleoside recognition domain-containing protein [Eubacteriales bacterium]|nr:nucleoside recognition domain-containing protein [Eubacteriales bacterium]